MSDDRYKKKEYIDKNELVNKLQELIDMVSDGVILIDEESINFDEVALLKFSFEYRKFRDTVKTKISVKPEIAAHAGNNTSGGVIEKPSYKRLKKSMNEKFKLIVIKIDEEILPDIDLAKTFYNECELMCTFEGKGDEYYPFFLKQAKELVSSIENNDFSQAQHLVTELMKRKSECHELYK